MGDGDGRVGAHPGVSYNALFRRDRHAHRIGILRARLLPAGAAVIAALRAAGVDELVLTAAGLRDGILIEFFESRR